ncbi:MAG: LacI family DNA-binding transcriptional regulator [Blautia sp.]|nr:LacI family DNA-binding transcriptional regulator [Blautia sp.]
MADRVTIQDIADALGLSRNTVSKAINNTGILADATREKVLQKAVEMGYKQFSYLSLTSDGKLNSGFSQSDKDPDTSEEISSDTPAQKRSIALFSSRMLGNSHFASTMLDNMQRELAALGYTLTMYRILPDEIKSGSLPYAFHLSDTAAIVCVEMFYTDYYEMLCGLNIPLLYIDAPVDLRTQTLRSDRLLMDNRTGIHAFIHEMARRGKTRIGFIGDYMHCQSFFERYMAFREAMLQLGLSVNESHCILKDPSQTVEFPTYADYLLAEIKKIPDLPDVWVCANDFIALDTMQVFKKLNISVPKDVWMCGFDDSPESRLVTPHLTSIHIHSQIMGFSAVQLLMSRIKNPDLHYRTLYTETSLIYRESTGD